MYVLGRTTGTRPGAQYLVLKYIICTWYYYTTCTGTRDQVDLDLCGSTGI